MEATPDSSKSQGLACKIGVVAGAVNDNVRRFVFQFDRAQFARFVIEDRHVAVLQEQEHSMVGLRRGQAGKDLLHQLLPLFDAVHDESVGPGGDRSAGRALLRVEIQHGEAVQVIGGAGFGRSPGGMGKGIPGAQRNADIQGWCRSGKPTDWSGSRARFVPGNGCADLAPRTLSRPGWRRVRHRPRRK